MEVIIRLRNFESGKEMNTFMTGQEIREQTQKILSKQLELLAEASRKCKPADLARLSETMVLVSKELRCN